MKQNFSFGTYTKATIIACVIGVLVAVVVLGAGKRLIAHFRENPVKVLSNQGNVNEENPDASKPLIKKVVPNLQKRSSTSTQLFIERAAKALPLSIGPVSLTADAYLASTFDSEFPIIELNADKLMPIASISKLITAVVADLYLDPELSVTITDEILATEGTTGKLRRGGVFKIKELYYPLLMVSSNDAAEAIARSANRELFITKMNEWANSIGATHTRFADPSGLSPENISTARDLLLIMKWIKTNNPNILEITKLKTKSLRMYTWVNPTHYLNMSSYLGGKNGFTDEADRTAASLFTVKGKNGQTKTVAAVILHSENRDADVLKLLNFAELSPL